MRAGKKNSFRITGLIADVASFISSVRSAQETNNIGSPQSRQFNQSGELLVAAGKSGPVMTIAPGKQATFVLQAQGRRPFTVAGRSQSKLR
jgi:hypothetical protein